MISNPQAYAKPKKWLTCRYDEDPKSLSARTSKLRGFFIVCNLQSLERDYLDAFTG